jgi:lipoyl(octanoyl) transferase
MNLHLLPDQSNNAAGNMAIDFLLLQRYPNPDVARFRHYGWRMPSVTFGYSQKWDDVSSSSEPEREFCRRPTGGGIVDHSADWTYSLIIPRHHSLYQQPATLAYYLVHRALLDALLAQDKDVTLQVTDDATASKKPGLCFAQPEPNDVMHRSTRKKIAGAALKRNKSGLLVQGSVSCLSLPGLDWCHFRHNFITFLSHCLSADAEDRPFPDFDSDEEINLIEQFSSPEWNRRR